MTARPLDFARPFIRFSINNGKTLRPINIIYGRQVGNEQQMSHVGFEASLLKVMILVTFYFLENYIFFIKISQIRIATIKGCPYKGIFHDSEAALVFNYVF